MKGLNKRSFLKSIQFFILSLILGVFLMGCGLTTDSTSENSQSGTLDLPSLDSTTQNTVTQETTAPQVQGKKLTMDLYFPDKGNEAVRMETHELTVVSGAVLRAAVEGLMAGPDNSNLVSPVPAGTKLLGINLKSDLAIVDFSKEFLGTNDVAEAVEKVSLVDTLTQFPGINKVKILIEGNDWVAPSGEPFGEMTKVQLDGDGKPIQG